MHFPKTTDYQGRSSECTTDCEPTQARYPVSAAPAAPSSAKARAGKRGASSGSACKCLSIDSGETALKPVYCGSAEERRCTRFLQESFLTCWARCLEDLVLCHHHPQPVHAIAENQVLCYPTASLAWLVVGVNAVLHRRCWPSDSAGSMCKALSEPCLILASAGLVSAWDWCPIWWRVNQAWPN